MREGDTDLQLKKSKLLFKFVTFIHLTGNSNRKKDMVLDDLMTCRDGSINATKSVALPEGHLHPKSKLLIIRQISVFELYLQKLNTKRSLRQKCGIAPPSQIYGYTTAPYCINVKTELHQQRHQRVYLEARCSWSNDDAVQVPEEEI